MRRTKLSRDLQDIFYGPQEMDNTIKNKIYTTNYSALIEKL